MANYYIDLSCGSDENDGLCADKPKKTPAAVKAEAGDKVYIKRGGCDASGVREYFGII